MTRPRRAALSVAALVAGSLGLSACSSSSALDLAQQACAHVHRSIADWQQATAPGVTAARATALKTQASRELRDATPLAAQATSGDGSWNALQTTLLESGTIDEAHLMPSLEAQCAVADTNVNVNPQSPG
jgi:hypothetical protein